MVALALRKSWHPKRTPGIAPNKGYSGPRAKVAGEPAAFWRPPQRSSILGKGAGLVPMFDISQCHPYAFAADGPLLRPGPYELGQLENGIDLGDIIYLPHDGSR